jgi:sulfate/thiosulfate transport system ATP-binding protein
MPSRAGQPIDPGAPVDIRIVQAEKNYQGTTALRGVSLDIRAGELMALLGPSGSGKTTLLRLIAGLEIPDGGQVYFGHEDATALPVQKRQVGLVFQHYALFQHLTVAGNIAYGLRARGADWRPPEAEIRRRVEDLLDLMQLSGYGNRFPVQLSGGQRQRVALARALAVEPRVLLLDEPFGALDAKVRKDLRRWLREIHRRTGLTTIFVTHDQDEALELADRVAILNDGRVEQVGTPDMIYDHPATAFVTSFVGDTARIPVHVADGQVFFEGRRLSIPADGVRDGAGDLFVRPWDLRLHTEADAELTGTVSGTRRAGASRRAEIDIAPDIQVEMELTGDGAVPVGSRVHMRVARGRVFPRT